MINTYCSSENENNSINEEKNSLIKFKEDKSLIDSLDPYISAFTDNKYNTENLDCKLEKNNEEINNKNNIEDYKSNKNKCRFLIKKSQDIFNIKKKLKLGRQKKNSSKKGKHNKFQKDNIIRRCKANLVQNIFNYINICLKSNTKNTSQIKILQKICSRDTKSISKSDNLDWLNSKVRTIFSQKISSKIKIFESNYNSKLIQEIYQKNEETEVIKIMEKTVREMLRIYITNDEYNQFPGFKTIKDDISKFRKNKEPEDYINLYILHSKYFEMIFNNMIQRKRRKK